MRQRSSCRLGPAGPKAELLRLGKPVLVIGNGAEGGIFDLHDDPGGLDVVDVTQPGMISVLDKRLKEWLKRLQIANHEHEDLGVTA